MRLRRLQTVIFLRFAPCRCVELTWGESFAEKSCRMNHFIAKNYAIVFTIYAFRRVLGHGASYYGAYRFDNTHYVP